MEHFKEKHLTRHQQQEMKELSSRLEEVDKDSKKNVYMKKVKAKYEPHYKYFEDTKKREMDALRQLEEYLKGDTGHYHKNDLKTIRSALVKLDKH